MKDFQVKVPGTNFILKSNSTYRIEGKVSEHSPLEFQKAGFTRIPDKKFGAQVSVKFDPKRKIWDTGFYENSPCYISTRTKKEEVIKTVETLKKYLLPHLEESLPEGALSQKSTNTYFDDYRENINQKNTYNTYEPLHFWMLWNAFLDYVIAPVDEQKKPVYRDAMISTPFVIYDGSKKRNQEQDDTFEKAKATSTFMSKLLSDKPADKELLIDVSNYVGFKIGSKTDDKVAISQFENWVTNKQKSRQNVSQFNKKMEYFSKTKNKEELKLYNSVKIALKEGIITKDREELFLQGESLGMDAKKAAQTLNTNKALKKTLLEAMS